MIIPLILLGAAALYLLNSKTDLDVTSSKEGAVSQAITLDIDNISDSIGWTYFYAKGSPSVPWEEGKNGVDCSGYALMVSVRIGDLDPSCPDMNVTAIANECDKVTDPGPGDFALYPGHIMVVATTPDTNGHCGVIGASGGGRLTLGNDPNARVKTFASEQYRDDFICFMRWKPSFKYAK